MIWKNQIWDELDEVMLEPTDAPRPEGSMTEIDLDMVGREEDDDERENHNSRRFQPTV